MAHNPDEVGENKENPSVPASPELPETPAQTPEVAHVDDDTHRHEALERTREALAAAANQQSANTEQGEASQAAIRQLLSDLSEGLGTEISPETPPERLQEIEQIALERLSSNQAIGPDGERAIAALFSSGMASAERARLQARMAEGVGFTIAIDSPFARRYEIIASAFDNLRHSPVGEQGARDLLAMLAVSIAGRNDPDIVASLLAHVDTDIQRDDTFENTNRLASEAFSNLAHFANETVARDVLAMTAAGMFA